MVNQSTQAILVLDDDDTFRAFVVSLLQSSGLNVIEARSAREATMKLGSNNPLLAIVDYRLPESDGITWITKLREDGRNFPIVFLSGVWCDEKTFDWLRNILRVSLILKKPLLADLFLQQIESLLPKGLMKADSDQSSESQYAVDSDQALPLQTAIQESKPAEKKQDLKQRMALLRKDYAGELSQSWQKLTEIINKVHKDPENAVEKNQAIHIAHKIKGTAGSIGFAQIGEIAGKLENLLYGLDPSDPLSQIVWSEILRALPFGEELVKAIVEKLARVDESSVQSTQMPIYKLLLVGSRVQYCQYLTKLANMFSVEIEIIDSALSTRNKLKNQSTSYDAAILDLDCIGTKENLFGLAKDIRLAQGEKCIPLSVILSVEHQFKPEDMAYVGVSTLINKDSFKEEIEAAISKMLSAIQSEKSRILLVDDDEALTKFLTNLLSASGMIVQSLHKPIKIVSTAESFNPDLVLLDVTMPGLSGYDVCRILRATEKWQQLPVLFLTAKNDQASKSAAFQAGGNDFLCKPIISEEVLARIRAHIQNSMIKRQPQRDKLTGMLNTNDFIDAATKLLQRANNEGQSFTICLLSLDDFTKLSIQHGWFSMQKVLSALGQLLNSRFKADDLRARIGEACFALAFMGENSDRVEKIMSILRNEFADTKFSSDSVGHFKTMFSIGIAEYPADGNILKSMIEIANQRLTGIKLSSIR